LLSKFRPRLRRFRQRKMLFLRAGGLSVLVRAPHLPMPSTSTHKPSTPVTAIFVKPLTMRVNQLMPQRLQRTEHAMITITIAARNNASKPEIWPAILSPAWLLARSLAVAVVAEDLGADSAVEAAASPVAVVASAVVPSN